MALVDVYDALRSKRAYKEAFKHQKVCELIFADRGTHFDPDVVDAFIKIQQQFEMIFDSLN